MRFGWIVSMMAMMAIAAPLYAMAKEEAAPPPVAGKVPAGTYTLDKTHASLTFRVDHLGLSRYTARFTRMDAQLQFDPENLAASSVTASVDPTSIETDFPDPTPDFDAMLQSAEWLNAAKFPEITFQSTKIESTGADTMRMTGELGMHGVTHPVIMDVTFNGGYAGLPMDPSGARIGFSAKGILKRSDFGITVGIPAPGTTMGVGDEVEFMIEAEFTKPLDPTKSAE